MLKIEEYIARRKKEDNLNEFDLKARSENTKTCVDYIFEYFNNYLNTNAVEEKTALHNQKLEKYRKQLNNYEQEVIDWAVNINDKYGKHINQHIGNYLKNNDLFFIYNTDSEFRSVSYEFYNKLIKKLPFLKEQTEMLYIFIKDYHRVQSEQHYNYGLPFISEEINAWLENTWSKYQVNIALFAFNWIDKFYDNENTWPASHRSMSKLSFRKYDYNYKKKTNLFNINSLYRKIPKKSFIRGRKQDIETLFMYYWLNDMEGDDEYWQEYLEKVLPNLNK